MTSLKEKQAAARAEVVRLEDLEYEEEKQAQLNKLMQVADRVLKFLPKAVVQGERDHVYLYEHPVQIRVVIRRRNYHDSEVIQVAVEAHYDDLVQTPDDVKNIEELLYRYLDVTDKLKEEFGHELAVVAGSSDYFNVYF